MAYHENPLIHELFKERPIPKKGKKKIKKVLGEYKKGKLRSSSGEKVEDKKQKGKVKK